MKPENLDFNEAYRYIGGKGEPEENILKVMKACEKDVIEAAEPKYIYRFFDIEICDDGVYLPECDLKLLGNDIKNHLNGCFKACLFCATISNKVDMLIRRLEISDLTAALCSDALASVCIERVCDAVGREICEKMPGTYPTFRFSPGYGDLPISVQRNFLNVLNAQKWTGLTVSESGIMLPRKSVTAIIGFSNQPLSQKHRGCEMCKLNKVCSHDKCNFKI